MLKKHLPTIFAHASFLNHEIIITPKKQKTKYSNQNL